MVGHAVLCLLRSRYSKEKCCTRDFFTLIHFYARKKLLEGTFILADPDFVQKARDFVDGCKEIGE